MIKFDSELLIDNNLLNTSDYLNRVSAFVSINNAEGWYHLFSYLVKPDFLNSDKFYQDIEKLKKAKCIQTPLWIIGESAFINSPYHDEDFELLVTATDSCKKFDYVVWEAIANIAESEDSIRSEYHRQDLQTIVKYGSKALQMYHSYPESCINYLAINKVSLNDIYHLENMDILAQNRDIGNFLYAVMTDESAIEKSNYRRIIREMIDNKENKAYVFLVCCYAVGEQKSKTAQNILLKDYYYEISNLYNISELLKKVEERINVIDGDFQDVTIYGIDCGIKTPKTNVVQKIIKKILK